MTTTRQSQRGISLVELLVAITLGLLLSAAVIQVFVSSRGVFRAQDAQSRLQESGRFALGYLTRDIRMAGFAGCPLIDRVPVADHTTAAGEADRLAPDNILTGDDDSPAGTTLGTRTVAPGTDILRLRRASGDSARLDGPTTGAALTLAGEAASAALRQRLASGALLVVSDCLSVDIFRLSALAGSGNVQLTANAALGKSYGPDAEVMTLEQVDYFVGLTDRSAADGTPLRALFARPAGGTAYELVDGVEDLQVEFGVDTGSDRAADEYRDAGAVADWSRVVSVRVNLLLAGDEVTAPASGAGSQRLQFMGAEVAADGRPRQVFSSTVAIRNRLP